MGEVIKVTPEQTQKRQERKQKVQELKDRIKSGEFKIDAERLAQKLTQSGVLDD